MKRRDFLAAASLAAIAPISRLSRADTNSSKSQLQYYELKKYTLKSPEKQKLILDYLTAAEIPALNRIGIKPVGVFKMLEPAAPDLYVLLIHNSLNSVLAASSLIDSDPQYRKDYAKVLNAPISDPAYERISTSLLLAFDHMPKLEIPTKAGSRIFQLRIYESHNSIKAAKKVEMFNTGGEIALFRKTGLNPVFFGQAIIGQDLPNLTYMLAFDNIEQKDKSWDNFRKSPGWEKLKEDTYYADTVSKITNILLRPASCSQI
jgi:hypothetical protein